MAAFPSPADSPELSAQRRRYPAPRAGVPLTMLGVHCAHVAVLWPAAHDIAGVLPAPLHLADELRDGERYPVVLSLGTQHWVRPSFSRAEGLRYREAILAVPGVCWPDRPHDRFTYLPVLYLDRRVPIALGLATGFAKLSAQIDSDATSYVIEREGRPVIEARLGAPGPAAAPCEHEILSRSGLLAAIEAPIINRTPLAHLGAERSFATCQMSWHLDDARVESVDLEVTVHAGALPGIAAGTHRVAGIASGALGGYRMTNWWSISPPRPYPPRRRRRTSLLDSLWPGRAIR